MTRSHVSIFFVFVALAVAAMTFAGTASAGWTWDDDGVAQVDYP